MRLRNLAMLAGLLVLLAAYFFIYEEKQRVQESASMISSKQLLPYGPLDIDEVAFLGPYGETVMWQRDGDGWLITYPVTDRGEKSTIDMFLGQIAPGQKLEEYRDVPDLSVYGLAPPFASVILKSWKYGRTDTVHVGDKTPTSFRAYVTLGSSRTVVVTRELAHNVMQKTLYHLRDKNLLEPQERRVSGFTVISGGDRVSFVPSDEDWLLAGTSTKVDKYRIEPWLSRVTSAVIYEFVSESLKDTLRYGIGDPQRSAVIHTADSGPVRISFGRKEGEFVFAFRSGRDTIIKLEAGMLEAFDWLDDRLIIMNLTFVKPGEVEAVQWETPDTLLSLTLEANKWVRNDGEPPEPDNEAVKYLLMYLRSAVYESQITDRGIVSSAQPVAIITLGDRKGKVIDIISLYEFGDGDIGGISLSSGNAGRIAPGTYREILRAFSMIGDGTFRGIPQE